MPEQGRLIGGGWRCHMSDLALVRYLPDGVLDPSFGEDGVVRTQLQTGGSVQALDVHVLAGDGLMVAGAAGSDVVIARYRETGQLARTLLDTGLAVRAFFGDAVDPQATAVVIRQPVLVNAPGRAVPPPSGDTAVLNPPLITVAGTRRRAAGGREFVFSRHLPDGDLDQTLGGDGEVGVARFDVGDGTGRPSAITVDGRLGHTTVVGTLTFLRTEVIGVARHVRDGAADTAFAGDGSTFFAFTPDSDLRPVRGNAVVANRGRIYVAGNALPLDTTWRRLAVVAFKSDGPVDRSFGNEGLALASNIQADATARAVRTDGLGRVISAGTVRDRFLVARHQFNGALDAGFGDDGTTEVAFREGEGEALAVRLDPEERVIAAGHAAGQAAAVRLRGGRLDPEFGNGGRVRTVVGNQQNDERSRALAVAVDSRGRIVLACRIDADFV
jgi:uncharacterized delta-60 repeat protein